jgi:hypothetical protein
VIFFFHRDPDVPCKLKEHWNISSSSSWEVRLTEEQEKKTVKAVSSAFGVDPDSPSANSQTSERDYGVDMKPVVILPKLSLVQLGSGTRRKRGRPRRRVEESGDEKRGPEEEISTLQPGSPADFNSDLVDASDHDDSDRGKRIVKICTK